VRYVVEISEAAKADLRTITQQIALENPSAALKVFHLIKDRCDALDLLPDRGKAIRFNGELLIPKDL
jgi:plasmid stabilization system protein ParE